MKQTIQQQRGFSLIELLVSLGLFGIVSGITVASATGLLRRVGFENRSTLAALESRNALELMKTEFRMGSNSSPYLPGINMDNNQCSDVIAVTDTTLEFVVTHDDAGATTSSGRRTYHVGYEYDEAQKTLYRGSVELPTASCALTADPFQPSVRLVLATHISRWDADGDTTLDPVFSDDGTYINVAFMLSPDHPHGQVNTGLTTRLYQRNRE